MALRRALLACCLLPLALACGGGTPDDLASLQAAYDDAEYATVESAAPEVLKAAKADGAPASDMWQIEKLRLQAMARQGKGDAAVDMLTELKAEYPDRVEAPLYVNVCNMVKQAPTDDAVVQSVSVLDAGMKAHPEHKAAFESLIESIKASGDAAANEKLKQLGYL